MRFYFHPWNVTGTVVVGLAASVWGCCAHPNPGEFYQPPPPPAPLGTISDSIWRTQEVNAEASKFVVYQHEFKLNTDRLNLAAEDHLKQIAVQIHAGTNFPVVVERSMTSVRRDSTYQFPVNQQPELDLRRRRVVVAALAAMGVPDAEQRVVVAPAIAPGLHDVEAERAYYRTILSGFGGGGGGFGGGFGGFGT